MANDHRDNRNQNRPPKEEKSAIRFDNVGEAKKNGDSFSVPVVIFAWKGPRVLANQMIILRCEYAGSDHPLDLQTDPQGFARTTVSFPADQKPPVSIQAQISGTSFFTDKRNIPLPETTTSPQQKWQPEKIEAEAIPIGTEGDQLLNITVLPRANNLPPNTFFVTIFASFFPGGFKDVDIESDGTARKKIKVPPNHKEKIKFRVKGTEINDFFVISGPRIAKRPACSPDSGDCDLQKGIIKLFLSGLRNRGEQERKK